MAGGYPRIYSPKLSNYSNVLGTEKRALTKVQNVLRGRRVEPSDSQLYTKEPIPIRPGHASPAKKLEEAPGGENA